MFIALWKGIHQGDMLLLLEKKSIVKVSFTSIFKSFNCCTKVLYIIFPERSIVASLSRKYAGLYRLMNLFMNIDDNILV